jgi:hypothetical protein
MNDAEIAHYETLKSNALAELSMAVSVRNLERIEFLHNLILGYEAKIKGVSK